MKGPILVVEDDRDIRESLVDMLQDEGFLVISAENGKIGIELLQSSAHLPSLVLLDLTMPVMDGYAFRREQLKDPKFAAIPTALLSADGSLEEKAKLTGLKDYITKPINLSQLYALATRFCK